MVSLRGRKRFGRSVRNRCPGTFQSQLNLKFIRTGGKYIEVPYEYRASQYDHVCGMNIKKKLSQRMFYLSDGRIVQRDWYFSFLLYCIDFDKLVINRDKCMECFELLYKKELEMIELIKRNRVRIMNSGIKIA